MMKKVEYPISRQAQQFIDVFNKLPDQIRMEIKASLCAGKIKSMTKDPRFEGYRQGPAPTQHSQTQGSTVCPTCGKPLDYGYRS
jgi:hypothetical protein